MSSAPVDPFVPQTGSRWSYLDWPGRVFTVEAIIAPATIHADAAAERAAAVRSGKACCRDSIDGNLRLLPLRDFGIQDGARRLIPATKGGPRGRAA
jgi:hypothetical protein